MKPSKKHLMYSKIYQNRGLNCIRISQYELPIFSSKKCSFWQRLWILKIYPNFEPRFQPKKSLFLKNSTRNFFVPNDHMNIFTHIPTCFSSIWDGLKSIFGSLESAKLCVHSFKITILLDFHESSFQPISHWVDLPCKIVFQSN